MLEKHTLKWWKLKESERKFNVTAQKGFEKIEYDYIEYTQEKKEGAHKAIIRNFTNAILYGEELLAPGIEGIHELTLSNAAYLSAWSNNAEVKLPFDEKLFEKLLEERMEESSIKASEVKYELPTEGYKERWQVNW